MRILIIGGTGFMGPCTVAYLGQAGHEVTVFHRGKTAAPVAAEQSVSEQIIPEQIIGNHHQLAEFRSEFARRNFDVVIDFILSSGRQATTLMEVFRGIAGHVVALSSMDVYRAIGILHGTETGSLQEVPLTEESELRRNRNTYSPEAMKRVREIYPWMDDEYDKIPVEEAVLGDRDLPGTVLRLPMVYGPGDPLHRFHYVLKRMDDGRASIIFSDDVAAWRTPRGYVKNVGAAIALGATSDQASGRVYNICEEESFSELEWARKIADAVGWQGEFVVLPRDKTPRHLVMPSRLEQHLVGSSERIRRELGYREPVPIADALGRTIEWEREHQPNQPSFAPFNYTEEDAALLQWKATA